MSHRGYAASVVCLLAFVLAIRASQSPPGGNHDAARKALAEAIRRLEAPSKDRPGTTVYECLSWQERLEVDLLRREAAALVKGDRP